MEEKLVMIRTVDIMPHPDNPRQNIGDIEELTESIKKNGIMQNLTVIPTDIPGKYRALIGHRRLAAAKAAGLKEVPAKVVEGLTIEQQLTIMLEENMQRTDLTVPEQAYGFQMMLDLGNTEEQIAQKTGFSRTTVHHRLQIAKLNKKVLQKTWEDNEFQLTLTDLVELEKVKDVKERDHMLKTARDNRDLRYKIRLYVEKKRRKENKEVIIKKLEEMGIRQMSDGQYNQRYSARWTQACSFSLEEDPPEKLTITGMEDPEKTFYAPVNEWDCWILIYKRSPKDKETEQTQYEKERAEKDRKYKEIVKLHTQCKQIRKIFIQGILEGTYGKPADARKAQEDLIEAAIGLSVQMYPERIGQWIMNKDTYRQTPEEKEEVLEKVQQMDSTEKLLVLIDNAARDRQIMSEWDSKYYKDIGDGLCYFHSILEEQWGFRIEDEEMKKMLDGTHEYYAKEKK